MKRHLSGISLLQLVILLVAALAFTACGSSDGGPGPGPIIVNALPASNVVLDDALNAGDGSDLVITFTAPGDESNVAEYRIIIVKAANAGGFDLAAAEGLSADRYTTQVKGPAQHAVTLTAATTDTDGDAVVDGERYVSFVHSVAGGAATSGALSSSSNAVTVAVTTIKITYLGNAGVLIEDDQHAVLIDALSGNLSGWIQLPSAEFSRLSQGSSPYDVVDVAMASHNHGDHFSPTAVNSFMNGNSQAMFIGPPQVLSGLSLGPRAVAIAPAFGTSDQTTVNDVTVEVLHLRHFDQFSNDFSGVENYGFVVQLGGKSIVHLGDVDYAASNLSPFGLAADNVDVVIIPTFNTLLNATNATAIMTEIAPTNVVALHFQAPLVNSESNQATSLYPGATAFTQALQFARF